MAAKKEIKKEEKRRKPKISLAANILLIIGLVILAANGILILVMQSWIIDTMKATLGSSISPVLLTTLGVIWLILALLAGTANFRINKTASREWSWFLFVLAIIILISGRIESGILILLSSIIYLSKTKTEKEKEKLPSKGIAIAGLVVNLILPGLGTIVFRRNDIGIIQLVCSILGILFSFSLVGILIGLPLFLAMWVWALVVGIKRLKKASK